MTVLVIGQGAVGRALTAGLLARAFDVENVSARATRSPLAPPVETIIYAGGPAGEIATRVDPPLAFHLHYERVMELVAWASRPAPTRRRLVLIGTVLPNVGLYGALKQVALDHAREDAEAWNRGPAILALRCGQIIGPEMPVDGTGVVATWIRQAVRGEPLRVDCSAHHPPPSALWTSAHEPPPPLAVTLCAYLTLRIADWLRAPITATWEEERACLPDPLDLVELARACAFIGSRTTPGILPAQTLTKWSCGTPIPYAASVGPSPITEALWAMAARAAAHEIPA